MFCQSQSDIFLFLDQFEAFAHVLVGVGFVIFIFECVPSLLAILFLFEFLESAGGLAPEGEIWQFFVFGWGEGEVGGYEDVLVLQVLLSSLSLLTLVLLVDGQFNMV